MPFPLAAVLAGGGALLSMIGKKKSSDAARKKAEDEKRLAFEAAQKAHAVREKARISGLRGLQASVGARGIKGGLESFDPAMFEERPFTGAPPSEESGMSGLGEALSFGGGLASAAGDFQVQRERDAELDAIMCRINPAFCPGVTMPEKLDTTPNPCDIDPNLPGC